MRRPAIADGVLFIGSWDSYFYAIDASTGKEKWRFKTGEDPDIHNQDGIQSSAAVADGMVYFGCRDSHLYALDAKTGEKKWAFGANGSWVVSSPAVQGWQSLFRDFGLKLAVCARCQVGSRAALIGIQPLVPVFVAGSGRQSAVRRVTQGKLVAVDLAGFQPTGPLRPTG